MKPIYATLILITISATSFAQNFYIYTADSSGLWSASQNWSRQLRTDGISKHKYIIPKNIEITLGNDVSNLGDVEINIAGNLKLATSVNFQLSQNSSIVLNSGSITGSNANQKIKIGSEIKYKGNVDGVLSGNFMADNTTGSAPNGFVLFSILPVNFTGFYINRSANNVQLAWATDKEVNNSHFEVERSFNGNEWNKIAVVFTVADNFATNYSYTDKNISNPVVYYRIRQVDIDGRSIYSSVRTIRSGEAIPAVKVYGFQKNVVIDLNTSTKNNIVVTIVNNGGQVISRQSYNNPSYKINLNLQHVASGAYVVQVSDSKGWSEVRKVVL